MIYDDKYRKAKEEEELRNKKKGNGTRQIPTLQKNKQRSGEINEKELIETMQYLSDELE